MQKFLLVKGFNYIWIILSPNCGGHGELVIKTKEDFKFISDETTFYYIFGFLNPTASLSVDFYCAFCATHKNQANKCVRIQRTQY